MALTNERIRELWENYSPTKGIESFARSVEAEVRKDDEALIWQMLEAQMRAMRLLPPPAPAWRKRHEST